MLKFSCSRFTTFEMMKSFVKDLYDYEFTANVNEEESDEEEVILIDETPICQETLENIENSDEGGLDESGDESDEELILIDDDPNAKGQKTLVDYAESDEVSDSDSTGNTDDTDSSNSDGMEDADNTHCNLSLNISSESEIDVVLVE